jgi:MFS family permease
LTANTQATVFAPFRVRNFRYQWPADLATSWAFEMETLILGWYVLVETKSVLLLTAFASLQYVGTLIAPLFGVLGDRAGHRNVLCAMRAFYAVLAATMMSLALTGALTPVHVFVIAGLMGCVRPSDQVMRYALIGALMPPAQVTSAIGVARTTQDSARIVGALTGAGLVAQLGMGQAYVVVACLYATSFLLTTRITSTHASPGKAAGKAKSEGSNWRDLVDGVRHARNTPHILAVLCLAFVLNWTAFPLVFGLLPYVAREVFHTTQTGLGYFVASFAVGGLVGSILLSRFGSRIPAGRMTIVFCALWYVAILVFARMESPASGMLVLLLTGCAQCLGMSSMSAMLVRTTDDKLRGRIMGLRMLAIYGQPMGLLLSGPLIASHGYATTATVYCAVGLIIAFWMAVRWRAHLWRMDAPANAR